MILEGERTMWHKEAIIIPDYPQNRILNLFVAPVRGGILSIIHVKCCFTPRDNPCTRKTPPAIKIPMSAF